MLASRRDQLAETVVKSAILELFGAELIDEIEVNSGEDHSGDRALFATVFLKPAQQRMTGSQLRDAIGAAATALREIEDGRFPYVTILEAEDVHESAKDARPVA